MGFPPHLPEEETRHQGGPQTPSAAGPGTPQHQRPHRMGGGVPWQRAQTPLHKQPRHSQHGPPAPTGGHNRAPKFPYRAPKSPRGAGSAVLAGGPGQSRLPWEPGGSPQPLPTPGCTPGGAAPHIPRLQAPKSCCSPNNRYRCPHHNRARVPPGAGTPGKQLPPAASPRLGGGDSRILGPRPPRDAAELGRCFPMTGGSDGCSGTQLLPAVSPGPLAPLQGQIIFSPFCQIYGRKMGSDFFFNTRLGRKITRQRAGRRGSGLPGLPVPPGPLRRGAAGDAGAMPGQSAHPAAP